MCGALGPEDQGALVRAKREAKADEVFCQVQEDSAEPPRNLREGKEEDKTMHQRGFKRLPESVKGRSGQPGGGGLEPLPPGVRLRTEEVVFLFVALRLGGAEGRRGEVGVASGGAL